MKTRTMMCWVLLAAAVSGAAAPKKKATADDGVVKGVNELVARIREEKMPDKSVRDDARKWKPKDFSEIEKEFKRMSLDDVKVVLEMEARYGVSRYRNGGEDEYSVQLVVTDRKLIKHAGAVWGVETYLRDEGESDLVQDVKEGSVVTFEAVVSDAQVIEGVSYKHYPRGYLDSKERAEEEKVSEQYERAILIHLEVRDIKIVKVQAPAKQDRRRAAE